MNLDGFSDLNWLAVIGAALAYFVIGAVWYAPPVFGNIWMAAAGRSMEGEGPGAAIYAIPLVGAIMSSIAIALLAVATGTDTLTEGLTLGLIVGVGFALPIGLVTAIFESDKPKPIVWGLCTAGYHVAGAAVAGIIIGSWR